MLITIIVLYLLNSPTFKIKNIEVMGNSQVDKQKILEQSGIKIGNSIFSNINIISGLAKGIDTYAHIVTINASKPTIAVVGGGLDNIYPKENLRTV